MSGLLLSEDNQGCKKLKGTIQIIIVALREKLTTPRSVLEQRGWTVLQMYSAAKARVDESHTNSLTLKEALRVVAQEVLEREVATAQRAPRSDM